MKSTKKTTIPRFQSLEEEKEYWEARGPLAEGHEGKINQPKPRQKRSSFLAVRLTGEELTRLRDVAAEQGLGPSTFTRLMIKRAIEHRDSPPTVINLGELSQADKDRIEKKLEESASSIVNTLLSLLGIQGVKPENKNFKKVKAIVRA